LKIEKRKIERQISGFGNLWCRLGFCGMREIFCGGRIKQEPSSDTKLTSYGKGKEGRKFKVLR